MTFPFRPPCRSTTALLLVSWATYSAAFEPPCYEGRRLVAGASTFSRSGAISDDGVVLGVVTADAPYGSNYEDSYVLTPRKRVHGECPAS